MPFDRDEKQGADKAPETAPAGPEQEQDKKAQEAKAGPAPAKKGRVKRAPKQKKAERKRAPKERRFLETLARIFHRIPVGRAIGQMLYLLGFYAECKAVMVWRVAKTGGSFLWQILGWVFGGIFRSLGKFFKGLWHDLTEPFRRMVRGTRTVRTIVREEKREGTGQHTKKALGYLGSGVKAYIYLLGNLVKFVLPFAAAAVLVFTVDTVLSKQYGLAVEVNGEIVGYIADESVFETARATLRERIVAAGDRTGADWQVIPAYTIATVDSFTPVSSLVNGIMMSFDYDDDDALVEAYGVYVGGELLVTLDIERVEGMLGDILNAYYDPNDERGPELRFVQDVSYDAETAGVFFTTSVMSDDEIWAKLNSVEQEAEYYTARAGETLSEIAHDHDMPFQTLKSYNASYVASLGLEDEEELEADFEPGAGVTFLVQPEVRFLQVSKTYVDSRVTEQQYGTVYEENSRMPEGWSSVTRAGVNGEERVYYYVSEVDGIEIERQFAEDIPRETLVEPVDEVVSIGTRVVNIAGTGGVSDSYVYPVPTATRSSRGFSSGHIALDINAPEWTDVVAANGGTVVDAGYHWSYGNFIDIQHPDGILTRYAHNVALYVEIGDAVGQGQVIAGVGTTGTSTGYHLHFEMWVDGVAVDPLGYVRHPWT